MNCKNCNTEATQNYCPNCGQAVNLKRINGKYIIHEIEHVLHFERGILYTIKGLLTNPGENVKYFINENRSRLVKPIIFIIVTSLIYSIINHFFHIEDGYVNYSEAKRTATASIFQWIQDHYGYANIIMGIFIALWIMVFFRKSPFNFFEILILLCFVMGIGMLIFSLFAIIQGLTHINLMQVAAVLGFIYFTWAIGRFFDKSKALSYVKAFFSYLLGMLTFTFAAIILGIIIERL